MDSGPLQPVPAAATASAGRRHVDAPTPLVADGLLAVALAATVGALSWSGLSDLQIGTGVFDAYLGGMVVLHASVAARRRWPLPAFAAASLAMAVIAVLPNASGATGAGPPAAVPLLLLPSSLVFALMIASLAAAEQARRSLLPLTVGLVGVGVAAPRLHASGLAVLPGAYWTFVFVLVALAAVVVASWLVGRLTAVRARARRLDAEHTLERAVARERAEIARDVHDVVAHSLAVIVRQAEAGAYVAQANPAAAATSLQVVAQTGRSALTDMRTVLAPLRSDASVGSAPTAPLPGLAQVERLVESVRAGGLDVTRETVGTPRPLPTAIDLAAYRVLQEGLTNSLKHAGAQARVHVCLRWHDDRLDLSVADDGTGPSESVPGAGLGLAGLRERLAAVRGDLVAGPRPGGGFELSARIPLPVQAGR